MTEETSVIRIRLACGATGDDDHMVPDAFQASAPLDFPWRCSCAVH
jgi:hypothetical protein